MTSHLSDKLVSVKFILNKEELRTSLHLYVFFVIDLIGE